MRGAWCGMSDEGLKKEGGGGWLENISISFPFTVERL